MNANQHHAVIRALVAEVRRLRAVLDAQEEDAEYEAICEETRRCNEAWMRAERDYAAQRAEDQARRDRWAREDAMEKLERARRYGNEYAEEKALKELRSYI
jgi:hypothetical protein